MSQSIIYAQVDLVTEKEQIQAKIDELVKTDLPSLVMKNQVKVSKKGINIKKKHAYTDLFEFQSSFKVWQLTDYLLGFIPQVCSC